MQVLEEIAQYAINGERDKIVESVKMALENKIGPAEIIEDGMRQGIKVVGEKFEKLELFLPEMIKAADTMKIVVDYLQPYLESEKYSQSNTPKQLGTVVIGTVKDDMHDIGKDLVSTFLKLSGFDVHDLGVDVPVDDFIDSAEESNADIIAISALLTNTIHQIEDIISELEEQDLRQKYAVLIGGGPVTNEFANEVGADGYGEDFAEATKVAMQIIESRRS